MLSTPIPPPVVVPVRQAALPVGQLATTLPAVEIDTADSHTAHSRWRMFPPWLVSLVLHLNVMILLGLWIGTSDMTERIGAVEASWSDGSGGELISTLDSPSPADEALLEATELAPLVDPKSVSPEKLEVALTLLHSASAAAQVTAGKNSHGDSQEGSPGEDDDEAASTSIFGLEGNGKRFVYVFDRSASMESGFELTYPGRKPERYIFLDGAKQELLASLSHLNERHRFQIIFYNDFPKLFQGYRGMKQLIPANGRAKELAMTYLYDLEADGDTYHIAALEMALRLRPDVIFLLTDGEEKDDPSPRDVLDITQQNKGHAAINVIQICREPRPDSTLVKLAHENGGKHMFLDIDQLFEAMKRNVERKSLVD